MEIQATKLKEEEKLAYCLRSLYEGCGYKKYRMSRFEEYSLYLENKSFLPSENIISFSGRDGRLMALRPDVTLSIVKNTKADREKTEKLFYNENVYRVSKESLEYKEISQMGVELIGEVDEYSEAELINLALCSLKTVDKEFVLDISHMGFVDGFLDEIGIKSVAVKDKFYELLSSKNIYGLKDLASQEKLSADSVQKIEKLISINGKIENTLPQIKSLVSGEIMKKAFGEIESLYKNLEKTDCVGRLNLDFSIVNDIAYYNGLIFQGYVKRAPKAILTGGRYDKLLEKFGKSAQALGFAICLGELEKYYNTATSGVDIVLLYDEKCDISTVLSEAEILREQAFSVRVDKTVPLDIKYKRLFKMTNGKAKEMQNA